MNEELEVSLIPKANDDYGANSIYELEGLEGVVEKPMMYIGDTSSETGLHHMFTEILDNSVDENIAGFCNEIQVCLKPDNVLVIKDNGRGIPTDVHADGMSVLTKAATKLHTGGKFQKENSSYNVSGGLHGVGLTVVNALSEFLTIRSYRNGVIMGQDFYMDYLRDANGHIMYDKKGKPKKYIPAKYDKPVDKMGEYEVSDAFKSGTEICFKPLKEVFSKTVLNEETGKVHVESLSFSSLIIQEKMEKTAFLNPNLKMVFRDETVKEKNPNIMEYAADENDNVIKLNDYKTVVYEEDANGNVIAETTTWVSNDITNYLGLLSEGMGNPVVDVLHYKTVYPAITEKHGDVYLDISLQWFDEEDTVINCFANNIHTRDGGTHLDGFKQALTKVIKDYGLNNGKEKDKKDFQKVNGHDFLEGLVSIINVKVGDPRFKNQTKDELIVEDVKIAVRKYLEEALNRTFNEKPKVAQAIIERCLRAKRAREAANKARKLIQKDNAQNNYFMPLKLTDCQLRKPELCELFIVEGRSAAGSAKKGRDRKTQAIFELKGKPANTHDLNLSEVLENQEINQLIVSLGCRIGADFNIDKLRYHKIIMMTDADVDGQHIKSLLMAFFMKHMPELILKGHVYMAVSPLFKAKAIIGGKEVIHYLKDEAEKELFLKKNPNRKWEISRFKGLGEMNSNELKETTMSVNTRILEKLEYQEDKIMTEKVFEDLMGKEPEKRKEFYENYPIEQGWI